MLLLNGHPVAGTNFWCQTIPTVIGRVYQFEFWSQSVVAFNIAQLNVKLMEILLEPPQQVDCVIGFNTPYGLQPHRPPLKSVWSETTGIRGGNDFAIDDIAPLRNLHGNGSRLLLRS